VDEIRAALTSRGLSVSTLQPFEDGNELKIDLDLSGDRQESDRRDAQ